jgi:hypothetical protein
MLLFIEGFVQKFINSDMVIRITVMMKHKIAYQITSALKNNAIPIIKLKQTSVTELKMALKKKQFLDLQNATGRVSENNWICLKSSWGIGDSMDNQQRIDLDITPFVCEAFASNPKVYKLIERLYEKNRVKYYQTAKSSPWYKHKILTSQSIHKEIVAKRALPLLLEGEVEEILQIIKMGWPMIYNWTKKQKSISIDEAMTLVMPKNPSRNEELEKITNEEINSIFVVSLVMANILEKKIEESARYKILFGTLCHRMKWAEKENRFSYTALPQDEKAKVRQLKKEVYKYANINRFFVSFTASDCESLRKVNDAICFLFDSEGLSTSILEDEQLTEQDVEEILATYCIARPDLSDLDNVAQFLVTGNITKGLLRAYTRLKKQYFKTSKETLYLDLDSTQQEAREAKGEVERLSSIVLQHEKEIASLRKQIDNEYSRAAVEYRGQLKAAQSENLDLKKRFDAMKSRAEELENALFSQEIEEEASPVDLTLVRGIIVGGHQRWHSRMRQVLPENWRLIHPDEDIDLALIVGFDIVLFYIGYLSHAVYDLVADEAKRRGIPAGYLRKTNPVECLGEIRRAVLKISK